MSDNIQWESPEWLESGHRDAVRLCYSGPMLRVVQLTILTATLCACVGPAGRQASTDAEIASFLAADPGASDMARRFAPVARETDERCPPAATECELIIPNPNSLEAEYAHWVVQARDADGLSYSVPQFVLSEQFPLRLQTWVMRTDVPDDPSDQDFSLGSFSLGYWSINCRRGMYRVQTELAFSADGRVTSARKGARRRLRPASGSGEALLLSELCHRRTARPPPGYRPFD